jgi:diadenosine tetraphosphate (Ap4A) HIT family hydrolase
MARLGDAILEATGAERLNYELLGNLEPALHAHVIPRYLWEPAAQRRQAVWLNDWMAAAPFDPTIHSELQRRLVSLLQAR